MATPSTAPEPSVAAKATAAVAASKTGGWTRPFRYSAAFVRGTFHDAIQGIADWGSKGLKLGIAAAVVAWVAPALMAATGMTLAAGGTAAAFVALAAASPITAVVTAAMVGFFAAAAVGSAIGAVTGGIKAVGRMHRGEVYAEDLVVRSKIQKAAPPNRTDYRNHVRAQRRYGDAVSQYIMERQKEAESDRNTYWQDREHGNGGMSGRGF